MTQSERDTAERDTADIWIYRIGLAVVTLIMIPAVAGGIWLAWAAYTSHRQATERDLCIQVAGPDGYRWVPGGCYDQNPWTGQFTRVELP